MHPFCSPAVAPSCLRMKFPSQSLPKIGEEVDSVKRLLWLSALVVIVLFFWPAQVVACPNDPTAGLVAHYPLDGTANDATVNGIHGTTHGGVVFETGVCGQAARFDGLGTFINTPSTVVGSLSVFTISIWAKVDIYPAAQTYILVHDRENGDSAPNKHFEFRLQSNLMFSGWEANGGANTVLVVNNYQVDHGTQWVHLTETRDAAGVGEFWVDGVMVSTANGTIETSNSDDFMMGAIRLTGTGSEGQYFDGLIDDVRIYDRVLSDAEIGNLAMPVAVPLLSIWSHVMLCGTLLLIANALPSIHAIRSWSFRDSFSVT